MRTQQNIWPKHITVDKRIVKILSGSTYTNFPSAIRELIVNGYDADAENVWVEIDLKNEIILIRDDGKGMSEQDFAFYLRIAGKSRKKEETLTKAKRQIVGQFGVGFLSVLPFCEKYLIETKRKGSSEIVSATITSTEYFKNDFSAIDVDEIPIYGSVKNDQNLVNEQFTRIRLVGFSKLAKSFFNGDYTVKGRRGTTANYSPMELLKWNLCEYLPIKYNVDDPVGKKLDRVFKTSSNLPFNVHLNKSFLYRNIHAQNILEFSDKEEKIGQIKFTYALLTNYKPLEPIESRYLMQRNLNVGVGERTAFDLSLDGKVYGKLSHLTGEVNIIDGLNELISVSRDKFNFSSDYEKLKDFLRQKLIKWANELDKLQTYEKTISDLADNSKVGNINNLKREKIAHDIDILKNKGFTVKQNDSSRKTANNFNKATKEIFIPADNKDYSKSIKVLNKDYKLVLDEWDPENSNFPAIKIEKGKTYVNESYSLFQNKSTFDTFLKIHILMYKYLDEKIISGAAYKAFLKDVLKIFNKMNHD